MFAALDSRLKNGNVIQEDSTEAVETAQVAPASLTFPNCDITEVIPESDTLGDLSLDRLSFADQADDSETTPMTDPGRTLPVAISHANTTLNPFRPSLFHPFCLRSAAGFPEFTNYTVAFKDTLDYVFIDISSSGLDVCAVAPFPPESILREETAIPSSKFPSDHIAVVVDVQFLSTPHY